VSKQTLTESGEWREGAASVQLLPDTLRKLPGELVTKDVDDPDKAHEIDAPHVVSNIVKDFAKAQAPVEADTTEKVAKKLYAPGPGERGPVLQWYVDVTKMRVIAALVSKAMSEYHRGLDPDLTPCHLWFETNNVNEYVLRMGSPPPRSQRPKHLRDIDLVVDVRSPPRSIVELLAAKGIDIDIESAKRRADRERQLVTLS
jgi:hypothetical protein